MILLKKDNLFLQNMTLQFKGFNRSKIENHIADLKNY